MTSLLQPHFLPSRSLWFIIIIIHSNSLARLENRRRNLFGRAAARNPKKK